ncbi:MAG: hypothetical protein HY054_16040 [Proteobacteria bacterium]|nr:hypothetical protein [Pseudomonadota bacterium]
MSTTFFFALEHPGDWRPVRDYFYEACKCTEFWTAPNHFEKGPPDSQERDYYAVCNSYNLIGFDKPIGSSTTYKADVSIAFSWNKGPHYFIYSIEVLDACIRWLARSRGDAFLDLNGNPILGRAAGGPVRISEIWANGGGAKDKDTLRRDVPVAINALIREGLAYDIGPLKPFYS